MSPLRFFSSFETPVETGDSENVKVVLLKKFIFWSLFPGDFEETFAEDSDPQNEFDMIIGAIEDIVVDDQFQELQNRILEQNYHHFEVHQKLGHTPYRYLTPLCLCIWLILSDEKPFNIYICI